MLALRRVRPQVKHLEQDLKKVRYIRAVVFGEGLHGVCHLLLLGDDANIFREKAKEQPGGEHV